MTATLTSGTANLKSLICKHLYNIKGSLCSHYLVQIVLCNIAPLCSGDLHAAHQALS